MMAEKKVLYKVSLIAALILWASAISFTLLHLCGFIPQIFIWVFGFIILAFVSDYKDVIKRNKSERMSVALIAINFVVCMAYIACIAFLFGRYVVRMI